ncbi:hypothetical protein F480_00020 [Bibersteinia trehalosi Y31]|uniref:VENN motif-containing domain-containing protein n=1 Tax=Bibersteinia trehalosi Y31 TaxID=1261658 RepID=A0A179D0U1_BIBTR|nr:VENN motif pre-toxin domain-containing protein [Bibersteinia trehalosi]OAQ15776.1 hypothetical protein F480_00020 [Bibersteinia trehalosi Y31]
MNEVIKHITENTDNKALEALNVPLHILWGAVEAELAGGSATAGAVAAGVGELGAKVLAETVYGKQPSELNEEEKQNLLNASKALAGIASGVVSGGNGAETLANASIGMVVAENAVENNYLSNWQEQKRSQELKSCHGDARCEDQVRLYWGLVDIGQDVSFVSGAVAGVPENLAESVEGLISMFSSPIETIVAMKELIAREDTLSYIA